MDFVAFPEQELSQVRSVLAGDSGDQCDLPRLRRHFRGGGISVGSGDGVGSGSIVF